MEFAAKQCPPSNMEGNRLPLLISFLFLGLGAFVMVHHELWRDEVQSWLLARDSASALDLLVRQRYEGHPAFWQLLLMPLTRAFGTPVAMQCLHLAIATASVYLVVRWAPFSRLQRILFSFGYFPFYEYAIISRSYGLSVLLLVIFCCLYPLRHRHFLPVACTLVLLGHTSAMGLIMALVLFAALCVERLIQPARASEARRAHLHFYAGCALIVLGVVTSVIQIIPPADTGVAVGWRLEFSYDGLSDAAKALVGGYLPVPTPALNFWNHPMSADLRYYPLPLICCLAVSTYVLIIFVALRRSTVAAAVFGGGTAALLVFYYTKYAGSARHHGFLFICLVVAIWIHRSGMPSLDRPSRRSRAFEVSLTALFSLHVLGAGVAAVGEYRYPFSSASAVTAYLHQNGHDESLLVGYTDYSASALLGTSAQLELYYPQSKRLGSYIIWDQARLAKLSDRELIDAARSVARPKGQHLLLILDRSLDQRLVRTERISLLGSFTGAVVPDENFHVYQLD